MPVIKLKLKDEDKPFSVQADWVAQKSFRLTLPEEKESLVYEGQLFSTGQFSGWLVISQIDHLSRTVLCGGKILPYYGCLEDGIYTIWIDGEIIPVETLSQSPRRANDAVSGKNDHTGEIKAPLPGRILKVPVAIGDAVSKGTTLIVMESMKMETTLVAPMDGTIVACHCQPGDMVDKGKCLVILAPAAVE